MNAYLVLLIHEMDDLPLRLFADRDEAVAFAKNVQEMPSDEIRELYRTDCSTPVGVRIVKFVGGIPIQVTMRDFADAETSPN